MGTNHTHDNVQNSQPIARLWNVASSYQAIKSKFLILISANDQLSGQRLNMESYLRCELCTILMEVCKF